ncbi:restriction endonuclease subunit S [Escherichia coli]|uniref:restriction endonuclease subunit S n=2 Tax=Escherichia coli TaxID=562 RepID=UPI00227BC935|nr:restriction endonuclease subunit S [Escherichia coli]MCY5410285.1 restriction endonuclease subunit S [Salmonella enterica subsp. enterica serovar 1,4,[5],12:i:-]
MSELSYLEKLLDGVEVEWKPLKDVCDFKNGFAFKSSLFKETGLPIVRITNIDGFNVDLDEVKYFSLNDYKEDLSSFEVSMGNILIAMSGATTGKVGIYKKGTKCYLNQRVGKFIPKENILNNNYLYHFLLLNTETIYILAGGGAQPNLSSNALMSKLLIPIPCPDNPEKSLAIQSEIVRILDKFTALTAELTAELNMRKKQYNYYRDQLLSFDEEQEKPIYLEKLLDGVEVEWLPLSDLARIRNGKDHKSLSEGEFPVYGSGGIMRYVDTYAYNKPSVLIPRKGSLGNLFFIDVPFWTVDTIFYTEIDEAQIRPKYLYYFLSTVGLGEMNQAGGVPSQTQSVLNKLKIPIPCPDNPEKSLAIQSEIVRILDKFDTLTNSITEGLPREIELRQKQYEYYRDLLFSFPKPETASN